MRTLTLLLISCLPFFSILAQNIPIGAWRTHASYRSLQTVAVAQDRIYAGTLGSLFAYETDTQQSTILSKLDGFSETDVTRLAYDEQTQTLIVAYENGTIDLLQGNNLFTINAIARENSISESKQTSHIYIRDRRAYLSYDFGVVVLDLTQRQIRETYRNLGSGGNTIRIFGTAIANDRIFLATEQGILNASLSANLQDFRSWQLIPVSQGVPSGAATNIATANSKVYAAFANGGVYSLENNRWQRISDLPAGPIFFMEESRQKLLIGYRNRIVSLENAKSPVVITHPLIQRPQEAEYGANDKLWIADAASGLVSNQEGDFRQYSPNGTVANFFQRLSLRQSDVVALPGGYTGNFTPRRDSSGLSVFTPEGWRNSIFSNAQIPPLPNTATDLISSTYNPLTREFYVGSFGNGLFVRKPEGAWQAVTESGAPPRTAQITGLATDAEGTVWVAVYGASFNQPTLYARAPTGTWRSFVFNDFSARQPTSLLLDDNGFAWFPLASGGLWVFDPVTNRSRLLNNTTGRGGLPNNQVNALAKDAQGQVWVGTGRGAAYFFNPFEVFDSQTIDAITPIFDGRQILRDEVVTSLRVDGGNRKWFGTRNGAWLFDADITQQLAHFTAQNSPLLSDEVLDLEIQPVTGEVFFATAAGLISYRGTATEATEQHSNVKVFPNPVRPNFDGLVGISGLTANSIVKITDVSGRLVFQTRANGGTATWNVRDYTGRRAVSGVYLIFSSNDDGTEQFVAKVAVVN